MCKPCGCFTASHFRRNHWVTKRNPLAYPVYASRNLGQLSICISYLVFDSFQEKEWNLSPTTYMCSAQFVRSPWNIRRPRSPLNCNYWMFSIVGLTFTWSIGALEFLFKGIKISLITYVPPKWNFRNYFHVFCSLQVSWLFGIHW